MILRKPYAFLIKHFKLMHIILAICFFYLIYCTGSMINFINNYVDNTISVVGQEIVSILFNPGIFWLPILIIVFASVLCAVMTLKSKPRLFYIIVITVEIAILLVYFYARSTFALMEETIIDMRDVKALRDMLLYATMAQSIFSIFSVVRGVGFDIKKFDFGNDLHDLEISDEDSEEFEIALDFDLNDKKRSGKKFLRYIKYWVKEHKKIAVLVSFLVVFVVTGSICLNYIRTHKTYPQGKELIANGFSIIVNNSYIVNSDVKGNNITGKNAYLIVVDMTVRCLEKKPKTLITGAMELNIAGEVYHHTSKYNYQLIDLGTVYNEQLIGNEASRYLLVYEIPANASVSKMKVAFRDTNLNETTYISLRLNRFIEKKKTENYALGHTLLFEGSTLGQSALKINSYEIKNKFTIKYRYCTPRKKCIDSVEYLMPDLLSSNYNKALLKIDAEFLLDQRMSSPAVSDFYTLFKVFGKIEYEIAGKTKYQNVYLGSVKSSKVKENNVYYIEVFQEIKAADKITLIFTVRDREYRYKLK